jgi:hypothetical protein
VCFFSRQRLSEIFWHVHYFAGLANGPTLASFNSRLNSNIFET